MSWRNGLVIGSSACGSLGEPYVLWDTRVWRAGAIGQGLRAMPNLGTGGPLWDLDVIVQDYFGLKLTIAGHNDFKRLSSPHIPWSTVGGVPCNGPITIMTAFGDFPSNASSFAEADMLFSSHKYRSDLSLAQSLGSVENWASDIANANVTFVAVWHETPPNNFGFRGTTYNQWNLPSAADFTPGSLTQFQRNTLVAVTLDSVKDKCHKCFVNNVVGGGAREIPEQENGPGDEFFVIRHPTPGGSGGVGDCTAHDGETHIGSHHFFYMGEDQRPAPGAQPGVPFGPVVGSALFRGTVSAGSMQYWHDYFYGPAPAPLSPYVSPFPYSGGFSKWTDGTYAYHEFSGVAGGGSLVPVVGRTLPSTIDFWVVGGGGGSAGFQAPAGGGGGGGGEVVQMLGVAAPGSSRTFVQGVGGVSRTNGGDSTFMGYTARGGRGATSSTGGMNGNLVTPGGTRLLAERAAGGGGGAGGPGGNVIDTAGGGLGGAAFQIVTIGGSTIPWAAGGHGGGNTGTIPIRISNLVEPGGQATRFSSPDAPPLRGGGGGGRISSSNINGFPGAVGGLVIRYLLPTGPYVPPPALDGITWTARTAPDNFWWAVCWSPQLNLFVAVAAGGEGTSVMTSPDGINWTLRPSPMDGKIFRGVCWSPERNLFVAVGGFPATSPDGINWTMRTTPLESMLWQSVCWSPALGLFVAVADAGGMTERVMTSPDGITWTFRSGVVSFVVWKSVCWSPELGLFVAVGGAGQVMTSPDGITWTSRTTPTTNTSRSVCWSPSLNLFVTVASTGSGNRVTTSPDGITWTVRTSAADNSWRSVCSAPNLFAAVSSTGTGNRAMTSANGTTWTQRTSAADNEWQSVCYSPELNLLVAVAFSGAGNRVMTSP